MTMEFKLFIAVLATFMVMVHGFATPQQRSAFRGIGARLAMTTTDGDEVSPSPSPFLSYEIGVSTELAIEETVQGDGEEAKVGDIVTIGYEGKLLKDDSRFDGGTISFKLGEGKVIQGWDQGLLGMKVGGKRILKIPPGLAYGDRGAGDGIIPPNADLCFDCELKSVNEV